MKISYSLQTSLQNKLIIAMGLMLLPLVALAAGSLFFLQSMNDTLHEVTHGVTDSFQPVTHLQTLVLKAMYSPHHYLIYGYTEEREFFARLSREVDKAFAEVLATSASAEKLGLVVLGSGGVAASPDHQRGNPGHLPPYNGAGHNTRNGRPP